jgi:hypothetical protein
MRTIAVAMFLLTLLYSSAAIVAQATTGLSPDSRQAEEQAEEQLGQLEEIAMCHHAIKAAHHDAIAFNQNAYYRYILNTSKDAFGSNVYPIPKRCNYFETNWVLAYTNMSTEAKSAFDKTFHDEIGMSISDMATDAQFLTVVINKMAIEGDKAYFHDYMDKDIPK